VAYLDHMAEGRYQLGVGVSALPTDHQLFALNGRNREMTFEALEIMTRLWNDGPSDFNGEFWSMGETRSELPGLGYHLAPYQKPHPPVAIAGLTPGSANHKLAGEKGYIPRQPEHRPRRIRHGETLGCRRRRSPAKRQGARPECVADHSRHLRGTH
jgi:alkanesulfonate monooxygenase SsuD/methylene tetrahydromethanopterin reductase-like flavin-dependent oxidoreductase (luciferase family)